MKQLLFLAMVLFLFLYIAIDVAYEGCGGDEYHWMGLCHKAF